RVLLVVDGVRMNNAIYRSGHLQNAITIDNSIIENTEVIYGSNSIVYGSDAIGGVVHFETKTPQFRGENDTINNNGAEAYARYATANREKTAHFDFNLGWKKLATVTSVTFSEFEDLKMGQTPNNDYPDFGLVKYYADRIDNKDTTVRKSDFYKQIGTAYSQTDLLQKISFKPSNKFLLTLNTQYSTSSDVPRYDQLSDMKSDGNMKWAEWHYGPQNRLLTALSARIISENNFFSKVEILPHFQKIDEDRITRRFGDSLRTVREEDVNVFGLNVDFVKNNQTSNWYYGIELTHNLVTSTAYAEDILDGQRYTASTRYPDDGSTYSSAAAYVSFKNNFTEHATYSLGARYTQTVLSSNFADTTFVRLPFTEITSNNGAVTGNAGIAYHPSDKFRVYTSISTGFRAPNVDDVGKVFAKDDYVMVPNNQVKPEYSYNGELGFVKSFGDHDDLVINAVGFYTLLKDAIVRDFYSLNGTDSLAYDGDTLQVQTNKNVEEAVVYGITVNLGLKFSNDVMIKNSFTYTVGRSTTFDVPLAHIPPFYGRTDIILKSHPITVDVYMKYQGWKWISDYSPYGEDNEDQATVNGTPAWQTFNINVAFQLSKSFSFQAALENMMDVHYRPFASGVSGAGRNFIITLRADI
ncbi:MAG: TonB-dependent receptor, partial [Flavobacteriales bacterium]|nr:TonB-dependent receptor [Flavobacteriales bacterium]